VLCGAGHLDWDREALERCADIVEYISYHVYWGPKKGEDPHLSTLAEPYSSEKYLRFLWNLIEQVRRDRRVDHPIRISVDEWNVWYRKHDNQLEERYDLTDALAVAIYMNMMRRNCQAIGMANLAQMVNVIAPIFTSPEGMFLQTIYHPLRLAVEKSGPVALEAHVECDTYAADYLRLPEVPYLDVLASVDESAKKLFVSLVNLSAQESQAVDIVMQSGDLGSSGRAHVIAGEAPEVVNDFGKERVGCRTEELADVSACFTYTLPPLAHAVLELEIA